MWKSKPLSGLCAFSASALLSALLMNPVFATDENKPAYRFDDGLLQGSAVSLSHFNSGKWIPAGQYRVDVFVNQTLLGREDVLFLPDSAENPEPCFTFDFVKHAPFIIDVPEQNAVRTCLPIQKWVQGATFVFDLTRLRLDLSVPQARMRREPRAYLSPDKWDSGESVMFSNYSVSVQENRHRTFGPSRYGFVGLNSGVNLGMWRFRQQSTLNMTDRGGMYSRRWNALRTYAQRALPGIQSEMTLGDSFVSDSLFDSVGFRGLNLRTDPRMLPDYLRTYVPEVRGAATSNARIIVRQNQQVIYETNVTPGPFVISDLAASSYQGDLEVEVLESNGQSRRFIVPYSAVPESMRPGVGRYSFTVGQLRGDLDQSPNDLFGELTYQRGFSNAITLNAGSRLARNYASFLGGGVLATRYGAFGGNLTQAYSREQIASSMGWRMELNYSKHLETTGTTVALAGYRHSTEGFLDITEAMARRKRERPNDEQYLSPQQRNQWVFNLAQALGNYGQLSITGSSSDFYNEVPRDNQLQLAYFNTYRQWGYGFSYTRSKTPDGQSDDLSMLSVTVPLDSTFSAPSLASSMSHRRQSGTQLQSSASGTFGQNQQGSYGVDVGRDNQQRSTFTGASVQTRLAIGSVSGSVSQGQDFYQLGAGMRGSAVLHAGGLTLGPYLGETFGLVHAKGAEGAEVKYGQGARVNSDGYAVVPALSPYRYNEISLDSAQMDQHTELLNNQIKVAPYAGSAVVLRFDTLTGYGVLIRALDANSRPLPLGATVKDKRGRVIGTVGQASQIYARVEEQQGTLTVSLDDEGKKVCFLPYSLTNDQAKAPLVRLQTSCIFSGRNHGEL